MKISFIVALVLAGIAPPALARTPSELSRHAAWRAADTTIYDISTYLTPFVNKIADYKVGKVKFLDHHRAEVKALIYPRHQRLSMTVRIRKTRGGDYAVYLKNLKIVRR